jgi:WD40 repeat protein
LLTLAGYRKIGGVSGALARRAEQIFSAMHAPGRDAARQLFLRLVTLGENAEDTRRRVRRSELVPLAEPGVMDGLLEAFGRHRLLSFDRDPTTREPTVEIAHEALLGAWERLRDWIDDAREDIRTQRRLASSVADWQAAEGDPSFLLRGARLESAAAWSKTTTLQLAADDREYLDESVRVRDTERAEEEARVARERALERRSVRRMRGLVAVLTAAALVAGTLTFVSVGASRNARDAETAQLAQRLGAQALVEESVDLSLLLARQAVAIDDSPQTRSYLLAALLRSPEAARVMRGRQGDALHSGFLHSIDVSPDGTTIAVADYYTGLLFFDTRTYDQIGGRVPVRDDVVASVAYSPDGRTIAFGGEELHLIDADTREERAAVDVADEEPFLDAGVARIEFTPDGSRLVLVVQGGSDSNLVWISVRDADTLAPIGSDIAPDGFAGAFPSSWWQAPGFALTPDGRSAVIATDHDELVWWDLESRTPTRSLEIDSGRHPLALSPDGGTVAVGVDGGFELVDTRGGARRCVKRIIPSQCLQWEGADSTVLEAQGGAPNWLLFSPGGETVVSTSLNGTVALWDVETASLQATMRGHSSAVQQPVFGRDGTLYTVSHDGAAIAWDIDGDGGIGRRFDFTEDPLPNAGYSGHPGIMSPDGDLIAVGLQGHGIELRYAKDPRTWAGSLFDTGGEVKDLDFSPDGRMLSAAALGGVVTVWDVGSGTRLRTWTDEDNSAYTETAFSPDGRTLAVSTGNVLRLVDVASWTTIREIGPGEGRRSYGFPLLATLTFSADGTKIAASLTFEGGAGVWDVTTGRLIARVDRAPGDDDPNDGAALSPDGRILAVAGWSGPLVRILDVGSGNLVRELDTGLADGVYGMEFSPDGRVLAISGWEPSASLWDVATGARIGSTFTAGNGRAWIDLSPDGRRLLLTHADGRGALYDVDPESWKDRACAIANRTLTPDEWEKFLPGRPYEPACAT